MSKIIIVKVEEMTLKKQQQKNMRLIYALRG